VHADTLSCTHAHTHAHRHTQTQAQTQTQTQTQTDTDTDTETDTEPPSNTHARTQLQRTHARARIRTHERAHPHTHTGPLVACAPWLCMVWPVHVAHAQGCKVRLSARLTGPPHSQAPGPCHRLAVAAGSLAAAVPRALPGAPGPTRVWAVGPSPAGRVLEAVVGRVMRGDGGLRWSAAGGGAGVCAERSGDGVDTDGGGGGEDGGRGGVDCDGLGQGEDDDSDGGGGGDVLVACVPWLCMVWPAQCMVRRAVAGWAGPGKTGGPSTRIEGGRQGMRRCRRREGRNRTDT
jgi:hypothetical protein